MKNKNSVYLTFGDDLPRAVFTFDIIGRVLQTTVQADVDSDRFFILSESFDLGLIPAGKKNYTAAILKRSAYYRGGIVCDSDPRMQEQPDGFLYSLLYERDGRIWFHRFESASVPVVGLYRKKKSMGIITGPVAYDDERGFL